MAIDIRQPGIQVILKKNVQRQTVNGSAPVSARFVGQSLVVDLTPYLAESQPVRVNKSVRAPMGGFAVALADKVDTDVLDSLYGVIEPMDSIEIRLAANAYKYSASSLPIQMRGFVSQVQRMQGMAANGKPTRYVVINGHDYGKILQNMQVFLMPNAPEDAAAMITSFPFFAKFGDFSNIMDAAAFTQALFDKIVNPYLDTMRKSVPSTKNDNAALIAQRDSLIQQAGQLNHQTLSLIQQSIASGNAGQIAEKSAQLQQAQVLSNKAKALEAQATALDNKIKADMGTGASPIFNIQTDISVTGAQVSPFGVGTFSNGTIHSLIRSYGDIGPWNEFFIEDRETGPVAVYRPNPFLDPVTLEPIVTGSVVPTIVDVDAQDIISMTVSRTDANVANYFWVDCPRFNMVYDSLSRALAYQNGTMYVPTYGNVDPTLYGVRKMEETTQQAGADEANNGNGTKVGAARNASRNGAVEWMNSRRDLLYRQNRDNVVLEAGSIRLKGNEEIRAGRYLRVAHGATRSLFYIVDVVHDYTPFGNYFTEVKVERGTGFIDRIAASAGQQAPYYSEMVTKQ